MHLKTLEMVGFKSFASRTMFAFEPGISVLCGPNGSGKSNVADAVRWVLGEQSARAIRGRRGEDVIFLGSQGRQPLGLSEVSLTLDNGDGRIPLEYAEVKITRRLYRSGEAEYLVNGARVRLKDIHGWLLHAALDPDAYVVVGQGSVDELILQRAEERRVVLENAADIRRHQTRLAEARGKVAATEENLLRCRVVIEELEPHVKRLRAQADRAERYAACRGELQALASRWFRHALQDGSREVQEARATVAQARAESEQLEHALGELEVTIGQADQTAAAAEGELAIHEPALTALLGEQGRLAGDRGVATERRRAAAEAAARLRTELTSVESRVQALQGEGRLLEGALVADLAELDSWERSEYADGRTSNLAEEAVREADEALDRLRRESATLGADLRGLQSRLGEARGRVQRAERRRDQASEMATRLEAELAAARHRSEVLADQAAGCREAATALRVRSDEHARAREDLNRLLTAARSEQHQLSGEQQRLQIARRALQDAGSAQAGSGASVILKAGMPGAGSLLGGELHVPDHLQVAVSAALGESAQAVLVKDSDDAAAGLRLIQERDAVRTSLVLMNGAAETPAGESAVRFREVARALLESLPLHGFADELVTCDEALEIVRWRYLAAVLVAPDLTIAREAARRLAADVDMGVPWQIVTTSGEVLRWNGEWRAGHDRAGERLVARRHELATVDRALTEIRDRLGDVGGRVADAEQRVAALVGDERSARAELTVAEQTDRQAHLAAQAAATVVQRLVRETAQATTAGANAAAKLARAGEQVETLEGRLAMVERRDAEMIGVLEHAEAEATHLRAVLDEQRAARAERREEAAARRSAIQGREALVARLNGELATAERTLDGTRAQLEAETAREQAEVARARDLDVSAADAEVRAATLYATVAALRARRRMGAEKRATTERQAAELRSTIRGQRTVLEAAKLAEGRASDRLERVRREAQEYLEELDGDANVGQQLRLDFSLERPDHPTSTDEPLDDPEATRRRMNALRRELRAIGPVNDATLAEFVELRDRHAFLTTQTADLEATLVELRTAMSDLEGSMRVAFDDAFARVNAAFGEYFVRLFGGGHAELVLTRPDDVLETGVDIVARPPGKRLQPLVSLSGGERALTMVALIFGLLKTNPAPFCVLDEVDAALDESNVRRFTGMLEELSERTQFIVVTHNRATMEIAQALYGITMDTQGVSTVVSLRLPEPSSRSA